jgi:hypothetical protein
MGPTSEPAWRLVELISSVSIAPVVAPPKIQARSFRFSQTQRLAVIEAYRAGATMAALAKQSGVKRQMIISELLRKEGVAIRVHRAMSQAQIDQAAQLYRGGLSLQRIGDQLGWDPQHRRAAEDNDEQLVYLLLGLSDRWVSVQRRGQVISAVLAAMVTNVRPCLAGGQEPIEGLSGHVG